jgi:hypothetical protein
MTFRQEGLTIDRKPDYSVSEWLFDLKFSAGESLMTHARQACALQIF